MEAIRSMLRGFVNDPPDSDFQRGFLSAILAVSNEVMGMSGNDPDWIAANNLLNPDFNVAEMLAAACKKAFTVIDGGKTT